ncbi:hypothetical protein D9619_007507 [Psilocybe cf. subviscida]|uniref:Uncharacterized protein n=1 Tax=Psilocybe cf. subviscida TaxID=2480587 RepID=A0A8H5B201_9AGAR|nr:hypothetical protein D9619_007507 [Psilocybe cf. subviscida]
MARIKITKASTTLPGQKRSLAATGGAAAQNIQRAARRKLDAEAKDHLVLSQKVVTTDERVTRFSERIAAQRNKQP